MEKMTLSKEDFEFLIDVLGLCEKAAKDCANSNGFKDFLDSILPDEIKNLDKYQQMKREAKKEKNDKLDMIITLKAKIVQLKKQESGS